MPEDFKLMSTGELRAKIRLALRTFAEDTEHVWKRLDEQAQLNDQIGWYENDVVDIFQDYLNSRLLPIMEKL